MGNVLPSTEGRAMFSARKMQETGELLQVTLPALDKIDF